MIVQTSVASIKIILKSLRSFTECIWPDFGRFQFALICIEWRRFKATTSTDSDGQLWAGQLLTLATNINRSRRHEKVSGFCGCNTKCQDSFFTLRTNRGKDWENGKRETEWWCDGVEHPRTRAVEEWRRSQGDAWLIVRVLGQKFFALTSAARRVAFECDFDLSLAASQQKPPPT